MHFDIFMFLFLCLSKYYMHLAERENKKKEIQRLTFIYLYIVTIPYWFAVFDLTFRWYIFLAMSVKYAFCRYIVILLVIEVKVDDEKSCLVCCMLKYWPLKCSCQGCETRVIIISVWIYNTFFQYHNTINEYYLEDISTLRKAIMN